MLLILVKTIRMEVWMRLESGMALRHASARITLPVAITGTHLHFPVWERKFG